MKTIAYIRTCMLLILLSCIIHQLSSQEVIVPATEAGDSIFQSPSVSPSKTMLSEQETDSIVTADLRSCMYDYFNNTVSSYAFVYGCSTLGVYNVTVRSGGHLALSAPSDITINGPFDVQLGGQLSVNSEQPGNTRQSSIDMGIFSAPFQFSDSKNTADYTNEYAGRPGNDVFYRFTLTVPMSVTIKHCGSFGDTYLHLLDANGTRIAYNDDYSGAGACSNTTQSYLKQSLAAGTYYIVSEGYNSNGVILTTVTGEIMQSSFSYTYDASGNRITRQTSSTMSLAVPMNDADIIKEAEKIMEKEKRVYETYESGVKENDLLD